MFFYQDCLSISRSQSFPQMPLTMWFSGSGVLVSVHFLICIHMRPVVPLTLLPLLRLILLRAESLASRLWCPDCCCCTWSCSLWICSLMLLASWMAFITASWSPKSAVELRVDKMSEYRRVEDKTNEWFYTLYSNSSVVLLFCAERKWCVQRKSSFSFGTKIKDCLSDWNIF